MNSRFLLFFTLILSGLSLGGLESFSKTSPSGLGDDIFATNAPVLRLEIEIDKAGWKSLHENDHRYVRATVREGNSIITNVAIHLKGAAGSSRPLEDKPALTVSFSKFAQGQRFHGLRKIHLNNSVQDPSYSTENICGIMFNAAGVPAARVTNARVWLNHRDLGFYVVVEGSNEDFLGRHFKMTKGNLYDGGFTKEITDPLEKESGDDSNDESDLRALARTASIPDLRQRWSGLQKVLDVDRFVRFMALDILVWDWDGYIMNHNNYRVYHNPEDGKMVFFPHGMDQMFEEADGSLFSPNFGGLVAHAIMETPEGSALYRRYLRDLYRDVYKVNALTNRLNDLYARNSKAVEELGPDALRDYREAVARVRTRIINRSRGIAAQLAAEPEPLKFSENVAWIEDWVARGNADNSEGARLAKTDHEGKSALQITASSRTTASWRSKALLGPGRYRFEAEAASAGVAPIRDQKGEGAGIRISGTSAARLNSLSGDSGWKKLQFVFDVESSLSPVEFVCELRAASGSVWFDLKSLKLTQLPGH